MTNYLLLLLHVFDPKRLFVVNTAHPDTLGQEGGSLRDSRMNIIRIRALC